MGLEYAKVKSVAKRVNVKGDKLDKLVLETMRKISAIVGATLGPGGSAVLIERYEHSLPPMVTKDGVTVYRSLGFDDPVAHCIMEAARDAAIRTGSEAGDGTTTAAILSEAIVRRIHEFCKSNPRVSPQKVNRHLESVFRDHIEPAIRALSRRVDLDEDEGQRLLHSVAKVSANGDVDLADAVMEAYDLCGDEGNITIVEASGPSQYTVERIAGYPIPMGYESSCAKFYPQFINDAGRQVCSMEKPVFLLYHGQLTETQAVILLMEQVGAAWQERGYNHNVVLVATGFSESVLGDLALNFRNEHTINVFPLVAPRTIVPSSQLEFLLDMGAVTGATVHDPIDKPLERAGVADLGPGLEHFEANRYRSTVIGMADPTLVEMRIDEVKQQLSNPASELDAIFLRERIAKLAGGIAKLHVVGASNGELKEKRDRAEDAVCAVRGAIKHGCLPGGGWTLLKLCHILPRDPIIDGVLRWAFLEPFYRLVTNSGISVDEARGILDVIMLGIKDGRSVVYDFLENRHVGPYETGVLDSTPAVLEAVRNSISIAALLGTLGGTVVFGRDAELERTEALDVSAWLRDANTNEANDRW